MLYHKLLFKLITQGFWWSSSIAFHSWFQQLIEIYFLCLRTKLYISPFSEYDCIFRFQDTKTIIQFYPIFLSHWPHSPFEHLTLKDIGVSPLIILVPLFFRSVVPGLPISSLNCTCMCRNSASYLYEFIDNANLKL